MPKRQHDTFTQFVGNISKPWFGIVPWNEPSLSPVFVTENLHVQLTYLKVQQRWQEARATKRFADSGRPLIGELESHWKLFNYGFCQTADDSEKYFKIYYFLNKITKNENERLFQRNSHYKLP